MTDPLPAYRDAETAGQVLGNGGLQTSFRQELDGAWTVRFGPLGVDFNS